eukprot:s3527_g2.t1
MVPKLATRIVAGLVVVDAQLRGLIDASNCFLDYIQDCRETGRCCSAKMSCYEKDSQWSACMPYCIAGQAHNSDADSRLEHPGPWSCRQVLPTDQFLVAQAAKTLLLSPKQLRPLYSESFKRFDQDNSSTMDLNEFRHLLQEEFQQRGVEVSEDLVQKIWKDLDPSGSGAVNFTEFCRWTGWSSLQSTANSLGRSTEEIARLYYGKFKDFDAGSGTMEMNEFRTLLRRVLGREVQEHVFTTLWNDLDRDGTGSATFHDFSKWYFQWMSGDRPSMDTPQFNRYEYDQFQNKGCAVGSFALKDGILASKPVPKNLSDLSRHGGSWMAMAALALGLQSSRAETSFERDLKQKLQTAWRDSYYLCCPTRITGLKVPPSATTVRVDAQWR